jgi:nicotinate phosphoribosyltransferase
MKARTKARRRTPSTENEESRRQRLDEALDEGLKETFPASDAVAVIEPAPTPPGNNRGRAKVRGR